MDLNKLDLDRLKGDMTAALSDGLADLVEGTAEDLQAYSSAISQDLLLAGIAGDSDMQGQLLDQLKLLAELNRIRVENHAWVVVEKVVRVALRGVLAGAASVIL